MKSNQENYDQSLIQSERKVFGSLILVLIIFIGKLIGAFLTNSLALLSDTWHLATDILSLIISWWGLKMASKPADYDHTFGHYRYSILTALINNISLIGISLFIFYKAFKRYLNPSVVEPKGMIIFAILGLLVNILIVINLKNKKDNINVKSAFLHFIGDALADFGVLIGGIIIYFTNWVGIDTLLSAILACLILKSALAMTMECIHIFLEATPKSIDLNQVKNSMLDLKLVKEVKDLHVWSLSNEVIAMTAHVHADCKDIKECEKILYQIQGLLKEEFGIVHSTIQFESSPCSSCFHSQFDEKNKCLMCIDASLCNKFKKD